MKQIVTCLLMVLKFINLKQKNSEIVGTALSFGNTSKDWSVNNMKKTGLNGYAYDFSDDYDAIAVDDIVDIYNYLMRNNNIV